MPLMPKMLKHLQKDADKRRYRTGDGEGHYQPPWEVGGQEDDGASRRVPRQTLQRPAEW